LGRPLIVQTAVVAAKVVELPKPEQTLQAASD
jgi:hypothetical protein